MSDRAPTRTVAPTAQPEAPSVVRDVLSSPGRPLDADVREFVEPRFGQFGAAVPAIPPGKLGPPTVGRADDPVESAAEATSQRALETNPPTGAARADFASIRIHCDAPAAAAARSVNARAFTSGRHVVFGEGEYRPDTPAGQHLLSHELAHVAQPPAQGSALIRRQAVPGTIDPSAQSAEAPTPTPTPMPVPVDAAVRSAGTATTTATFKAAAASSALAGAGTKEAVAKDARAASDKATEAAAGHKKDASDKEPKEDEKPESASDLLKGNVALIDTELAEHQRWGAAGELVGAAGSAERAEFIAKEASSGALGGLKEGFKSGAKMGVGIKIAEKVIEKSMVAIATRLGSQVAKFTPLPGVGAAIGGAIAAYDLATRDWKATGEAIGRFGQGADIYEKLANTIEAVSNVLEVATAVLNVIAGILGLITVVMWIFAVATLGVMSPVAGILTAIAAGIGIGTLVLDAINALVLKQLITTFRALHTFTSQADPRDVVAQGEAISKSAGASAGFVGGVAATGAVELGAAGGKKLTTKKPPADHPPPPAATGEGPTVKAEPPVEGPKTAEVTGEPTAVTGEPTAVAGEPAAHTETAPPAEGQPASKPKPSAVEPATAPAGESPSPASEPAKPATETKATAPPEAEPPASKKSSQPKDEASFADLNDLIEEMDKGPFGDRLAAEAQRAMQPPATAPAGTRYGRSAYRLLRTLLRREQAQPFGTQAQHWTKWLAATRDTPVGQRMTPAQISENRSWLQTNPNRPATLLLTDPHGGGTRYFIGDQPAPRPSAQLDLPGMGEPQPAPRYTTEHRFADNFLIEDAKRKILGQQRQAQYPRGSLNIPPGTNRNLLNLWAGAEARWITEGTPGQGDWGWQPQTTTRTPVQQSLLPGERPQVPRSSTPVPTDPRQLTLDFDKPAANPNQLDLFSQPPKPAAVEPTTPPKEPSTSAPQPQPADQPTPASQPTPAQQPVTEEPPKLRIKVDEPEPPKPQAAKEMTEAERDALSEQEMQAEQEAAPAQKRMTFNPAAVPRGVGPKKEDSEPGLMKNVRDFTTMDMTSMSAAEKTMYIAGGPFGGGLAVTAVRGFEKGLSEPVVEHVNPQYPSPPGTPQQVTELENQMLDAQMAQARAEDAAARMSRQEKHHKENEEPLDNMQTRTQEAIAATEAHKQAVAERTEANKKKQDSEKEAGGVISDGADRLARLATITVPMRQLARFTGMAYALPDVLPESVTYAMPDFLITRGNSALKAGKGQLIKINTDSQNFLDQIDQMEQTINAQKAAQPGRLQEAQGDATTLGQTDQNADQSDKSFSDTKQKTEDLDTKNKDKLGEATQLRTEANQTAATAGATAQTKEQQSQSLAAALQAWAESHRQARVTALEATKEGLIARGYRITEVKEL